MKHGDMYTAGDGRKLLVVAVEDNDCRPRDIPFACGLMDLCPTERRPCRSRALIFVPKEDYLTYKLLGTGFSSS